MVTCYCTLNFILQYRTISIVWIHNDTVSSPSSGMWSSPMGSLARARIYHRSDSSFQFFTLLLQAVCVLAQPCHLCDATTWLVVLWLAGESSTSQRWGESLPVYWWSVRGKIRSKRYIELRPKAPSTKCHNFTCQVSERGFPNAVFPKSMEISWSDFHTETRGFRLTSFRTVNLLNTNDKLFDKILLTRILSQLSGRGFLRNEQFGFGPKHSTSV